VLNKYQLPDILAKNTLKEILVQSTHADIQNTTEEQLI